MPRVIVDIQGLAQRMPLTVNQIYKLCRRSDYPIPHKKCGKKLLFDLDRVFQWFDGLPGKDTTLSD